MRALLVFTLVSLATPALAWGRGGPSLEARANLKAGYTAEKAYMQEKDVYSSQVQEIGFSPERGNRYSYYFAEAGPAELRSSASPAMDWQTPRVMISVDFVRYPKAKFATKASDTKCPLALRDAPAMVKGVGVFRGTAAYEQEFVLLAAGNLDEDATFDCWSIASFSRHGPNGEPIPAGEPFHEQADLTPAEEEAAVAEAAREEAQRRKEENRAEALQYGFRDDKQIDVFVLFRLWFEIGQHLRLGDIPPSPETLRATLAQRAATSENDPWGVPYRLLRMVAPRREANLWTVLSAGPDKAFGTADDLAGVLVLDD